MKIGNVEIKNRVVFAPMAGISNSAYRRIIKEMGPGLIYAEMVSDKAITFGSKKTIDMLYMTESERPISQQIFGSDKKSFVEAAKFIYENMHPDIIDINMGCPVPKVAISSQAGSALLKDPDKVYEIVKAVKESVSIPVIGNGDIFSCYDAKRMLDTTGCDFVMIGRGSLGNPWLIKECVEYLENGTIPKEVTFEEKIDMIKKHLNLLRETKNDKVALLEIRTHIAYYLKGLKNSSELKNMIFKTKSFEEIEALLNEYKEKYND